MQRFTMLSSTLVVSFVLFNAASIQASAPPASQPAAPPDSPPAADARASDPRFLAVQAILEEHCLRCHGGARAARKANFESLENILAERAGRPTVVVAGDPDASEMYRRVTGTSEPRMPLDGPPYLSDAEIGVIRTWIVSLAGASLKPADGTPATSPEVVQPPTAPAVPKPVPVQEPSAQRPAMDAPVTFADVRPILATHCMRCHVNNGERGPAPEGLVLTNLESVLRSAERPVVIPGNASASLLLRHIVGTETPRMPFDGPPWVADEDVKLITRWINDGARDDQGKRSPVPVGLEVRFEGILTAQWAVDGIVFRVQSGARVRDIRIGGRVEVRATVQRDGSLLATRVRGR